MSWTEYYESNQVVNWVNRYMPPVLYTNTNSDTNTRCVVHRH